MHGQTLLRALLCLSLELIKKINFCEMKDISKSVSEIQFSSWLYDLHHSINQLKQE